MTQSQKLALRLSEIRQALNTLSALDEPTDEQRAEMAKLTTEYPLIEERSRAALVVEAADADVRRLQGRARLGAYLTAAASGAPVTGAAGFVFALTTAANEQPIVDQCAQACP